jgi:hypothetical protein
VQDNAENFTRFVLLVPESEAAARTTPNAHKMSIAMRLAHRPGALLASLEPFARHQVNLLKIESRPIHGRPWKYQFKSLYRSWQGGFASVTQFRDTGRGRGVRLWRSGLRLRPFLGCRDVRTRRVKLKRRDRRILFANSDLAAFPSLRKRNFMAWKQPKPCYDGSILYGLLMIVRVQTENLHAVVSSNFAQLRRAREIPYLALFDYLNSDPSVKKILILDRSVPPYYSQKPYVKLVGQWGELTLPQISTGLEALPHARELHITHVLDVVSSVSGFQIEHPPSNFELVFQSTGQRIYRVD